VSDKPARRWPLLLIVVSAVVGVIDGLLMTWDHLQFVLKTGAGICDAESACAITHAADVTINRIPLPFGMHPLPIAILAVGCYVVVGALAFKIWRKKAGSQRALSYLLIIGFLSLLLSVALAVYSLVYQGSICPYCAVLYGASLGLFVGALLFSRRPLKERVGELKPAFLSADTLVYLGVFFAVVTFTYAAYTGGIKPAPPELSQKVQQVKTEGRPVMGSLDAAVHLVEFADYGCPHCRDLFETLHELLESRKTKVKLTVLNFPLGNCHEARGSCFVPRAAECSFQQGGYAEFSDRAFELGAMSPVGQVEQLPNILKDLGLEPVAFTACMDADETMEKIKADRRHGLDLGVTGTPTLFLNGRRVSNATSLEDLEKMVDKMASEKAP
jgi:protein-disulfide isomerase